jgi:phenylpropionate dioxygenase-like ring-hydroxylating dioxygenase large terminal subunit
MEQTEMLDATFLALAARFWHPVARSSDVAAGTVVAARLLERDLAVYRDHDGDVHVLDGRCVHRGAQLSEGSVDGACLRCPYHAWAYAADGRCVEIPQLDPRQSIPDAARVPSLRASEHGGFVWTCLVGDGDELRTRPNWPVAGAGTHWLHVGRVYDWNAQAFRQIENFCDVSHFSVLHADTFGNDDELRVDPYQVAAFDDGWRLAFDYRYPSRDPTAEPGPDGKRPPAGTDFEYRLEVPFTVALGGASGPDTVMCIAASPMSPTTTRVFWMCAFPNGVEVDAGEYEELEARIWGPDRAIVEGQRPQRLPLDSGEELHLAFDRLAVAYRRRLREIGFGSSPPVDLVSASAATD